MYSSGLHFYLEYFSILMRISEVITVGMLMGGKTNLFKGVEKL